MPPQSISVSALEAALRAALPAQLHRHAPALAQLVADTAAGAITAEEASERLRTDIALSQLFASLAGQHVDAQGAVISFGAGSQLGDVSIQDVAGRDIIKFSVTVYESPAQPAWRRSLWAGAALILLIGSVLIIYQFVWPFLAPPPRMRGIFNVAVAPFGRITEGGRVDRSQETEDMAWAVHSTLDTAMGEIGAEYGIATMGPDGLPLIIGATQEEREKAAAQLAAQINADVIFYGTLDATGTLFTPEFYLAPQNLLRAEEVAGAYPFKLIENETDVASNPFTERRMRQRIADRSATLARLVLGLGAFASGVYDEAEDFFNQAAADPNWERGAGLELLLLFQGNTAGKLGEFQAAEMFYRQALQLDGEYARARLGLAAVQLQRAKGSCTPETADVVGLQGALQMYELALAARNQPALADIGTKAHAGIGQAHLCLDEALGGGHARQAEQAFQSVIADYQPEDGGSPNERVRYLAAEAHANLGALSLPYQDETGVLAEDKYRAALHHYKQAIDLSVDRQLLPLYYRMAGFLHGRLGEYAEADHAYATAIARSSATLRPTFEAERQQLRSLR